MTLASQMSGDVPTVFLNTDDHAEEIVYRDDNGTPATIKAVVLREEDLMTQQVQFGRDIDRTMTIFCSTSASTGVSALSERAEFSIDGETWKPFGRPVKDGYGMQRIALKSVKRRETSHEQYRR